MSIYFFSFCFRFIFPSLFGCLFSLPRFLLSFVFFSHVRRIKSNQEKRTAVFSFLFCLSYYSYLILNHKEVLKKGLLKRIGNGNLTNIWHDRIPNHFDGKPLVLPNAPLVTTVSDLITESGGWNEELMKQIFVDVDATAF